MVIPFDCILDAILHSSLGLITIWRGREEEEKEGGEREKERHWREK